MIELKGSKVVFRQKPIDWASGMSYMKGTFTYANCSLFLWLTLAHLTALVALSEFLESQSAPLVSIPDSHLSVIAKLIHERWGAHSQVL